MSDEEKTREQIIDIVNNEEPVKEEIKEEVKEIVKEEKDGRRFEAGFT